MTDKIKLPETLINYESDSLEVLKQCIDVCFKNSDIKIKSFERDNYKIIFFTQEKIFNFSKPLDIETIYVLLLNNIKIIKKNKKNKDKNVFFIFNNDQKDGSLFSIEFITK